MWKQWITEKNQMWNIIIFSTWAPMLKYQYHEATHISSFWIDFWIHKWSNEKHSSTSRRHQVFLQFIIICPWVLRKLPWNEIYYYWNCWKECCAITNYTKSFFWSRVPCGDSWVGCSTYKTWRRQMYAKGCWQWLSGFCLWWTWP